MKMSLFLFSLSFIALSQELTDFSEFRSNEFTNSIYKKSIEYNDAIKKAEPGTESKRIREKFSVRIAFSDGVESILSPPFKFQRKDKQFECDCGEYSFSFYDNALGSTTKRTIKVNNSKPNGKKSILYVGSDSKEYRVDNLTNFNGNLIAGVKGSLAPSTLKSENGKWKDSFAQKERQCKASDVTDKNPKLKKYFSSPKNQGSIGWCFGFTASDLMTVKLGTPVSSIHSSIVYQKTIEKDTPTLQDLIRNITQNKDRKIFQSIKEVGDVGLTLLAIADNKKICSETDLPFDADLKSGTKELIKSFETLKYNFSTSADKRQSVCQDISNFLILHPEIKANYQELYAALVMDNIGTSFEEMVQANCSERLINVPKIKVRSLLRPNGKRGRTRRFFRKLNKLLDSGKPLSLSYDSSHIKRNESGGGHGSTLVGKRWKDGECQYKIRNSWGKTCLPYNPHTVVECNRDEGAFWVSEKTLFRMTLSLDYIK